eukprot:jgi/Tetstr1/426310/TSEL_016626.t1
MAKELRKSRGEELFAVAVREVFDAVAELRTDQSTEWTEELKESLMEFADIIAEPTDLPPEREFDFEINLESDEPPKERTYRMSPAELQETMMNRVLSPYLGKFCVVYLDDVLIYSKTAQEHLEHIKLVLRELQRHHLHIKLSKCSFGRTSVEFLGHIVEAGQIKMDPRKVEAVQQWPVPKTVKDVRGFLGLAGYYRKFIHNFAAIAAPLHDLTKNQPEFVWTPRADAAFRALKDAMGLKNRLKLEPNTESGYEAVRPVSRVPGLFPLSTDLTNEYLKQDDRRVPAKEEYLWMSCFGAHMAALFVALDELLPYVPVASQDFTPYLARARNHAEAIDKAFRFRLAFLRKLNEIKRVHGDQGVLDVLRAQHFQPASEHLGSAIFGDLMKDYERRVFEATVASNAKATATARVAAAAAGCVRLGRAGPANARPALKLPQRSNTQELRRQTVSVFAEFCHDSENISPLEATTATVVRYVAWIGERGHIAAKSLQPYLSAINTFFELHNLVPIAKDSLHLTSARRGLMLRQRRLDAAPLRVPLPADVAYRFVTKAELIVSAPYPEYHLDFRALLASVVNFMFFARGLTGVSCRVRDVHVDTYNITLQVYREKGRAGRRGPDDLRVLLLPVSEHPRVARLLHHFIDNVQSVPLVTVGLATSNFWVVTAAERSKPWTAATMSDWLSAAISLVNAAPPAGTSWTSLSLRKGAAFAANAIGVPLSHIRYQGGWATNSDVVLDYIDPNVLPSPGAWFFFGHIAPLRHFQVQQDSAAVAFPVPPS